MSSGGNSDDRIVSITFDNSRFQARVAETIASVKALDQQLKMTNGTQGLSDISKAASKVDFAPIAQGIEGISAKFAAMATIGITALSNLTNKAVDAGIAMTKSLTIGSAQSGFGEYETNMGSIQTILANTASDNTNLGDVNSTLQQLNEYSDKTIYNFAQMAKNIGTFTAAGVDLETSAGAIKGIANVAAISGSNSEQASAAMYQLSQALATGTVKLIDWNSVVNAGMGGEVFQKSLWETGKALGTITETDVSGTFEEWKAAGNSFRESLADEWLTSDVLTTSLGAFTGDLDAAALEAKGFSADVAEEMVKTGIMAQKAATEVKTATQLFSTLAETAGSGWAKSFSWILGDFNESKALFTGINDVLGAMLNKSADTRNAILGGWKVLGGRDDVIQGLKNAFIALQFVMKPIIDAFRSLFPKKTGNDLARYSEAFKKFTEKLIITVETAGKIKTIFTGVFSILKVVTTIFREAGKYIWKIFSGMRETGKKFVGVIEGLSKTAVNFRKMMVEGKGVENFFKSLPTSFSELKAKMLAFFKGLPSPKEFLAGLPDALKDLRDKFTSIFDGEGFLDKFSFDNVAEMVNKLGERFKFLAPVTDIVSKGIEKLETAFNKAKDSFGGFDPMVARIKEGFEGVKDAISKLDGIFDSAAEKIKSAVQSIMDAVGKVFNAGGKVFSKEGAITAAFAGLGVIVFKIVQYIKTFSPSKFVEQIHDIFDSVTETLGAMQAKLKAEALLKLSIAIGVLVAALVLVSLIDPAAMMRGLGGIVAIVGILIGTMALMNKVVGDKETVGKVALMGFMFIALAAAILILSAAIAILGNMKWEDLGKGLAGIAGALGILIAGVALLNKIVDGDTMSVKLLIISGAFVLMAGSLIILALAMKIMASMSWEELARGLVGVGASLAIMVTAINNISMDTSGMIRAAVAIGLISLAMVVLGVALKVFASMNWKELGTGLVGVAASLAILVTALNNITIDTKGLISSGLAMIFIAFAMKMMANAVISFAAIPIRDLIVGLVSIATTLGILVVALNAMPDDMIRVALGLLGVSISLKILSDIVVTFGSMQFGEIAKGLGAMAALLLILVVAMNAMSSAILGAASMVIIAGALTVLADVLVKLGELSIGQIVTGLLALAGLFLVVGIAATVLGPMLPVIFGLGLALLSIAAAAALFGAAATLIATAFEKFVKIGSSDLSALLDTLGELAKKLPPIITTFGVGLLDGFRKILAKFPAIIVEFEGVIRQFFQSFVKLAPEATKVVIAFGDMILESLRKLVPKMIEVGLEIILALLKGLDENIEQIAGHALSIITKFITTLSENIGPLVEAGANFIVNFLNGIADNIGSVITAGLNVLTNFLDGLANNSEKVVTAVNGLVTKVISGLGSIGTNMATEGAKALGSFLDALTDDVVLIGEKIGALLTTIVEEIGKNVIKVTTRATALAGEFLDALTSDTVMIATKVTTFITTFIDEINKNTQLIIDAGTDLIVDFLNGVAESTTEICTAAQGVITSFADCLGELTDLLLEKGGEIVGDVIDGIVGKFTEVGYAAARMARQFIDALTEKALELLGKGKEMAGDVIDGIVEGVKNGVGLVVSAFTGMVSDAYNGAKEFLGINSPSRLMMEMGSHVAGGLAKGVDDNQNLVAKSGSRLGAGLAAAVTSAVNGVGDMDIQPVITPVIDLSQVSKGLRGIESNRSLTLKPDLGSLNDIDVQGRESEPQSGATISTTYNQTINAPKALSEREVYRSTRSMLARARTAA